MGENEDVARLLALRAELVRAAQAMRLQRLIATPQPLNTRSPGRRSFFSGAL